jgi:hypothetical protein
MSTQAKSSVKIRPRTFTALVTTHSAHLLPLGEYSLDHPLAEPLPGKAQSISTVSNTLMRILVVMSSSGLEPRRHHSSDGFHAPTASLAKPLY